MSIRKTIGAATRKQIQKKHQDRLRRKRRALQNSFRFETLEDRIVLSFSTPILSFAGQGGSGSAPPDTVGDVGVFHYIQATNSPGVGGTNVTIYNKADGSVAVPQFELDSLAAGATGGQAYTGNGDPIVIYDQFADRWLLLEFTPNGTDQIHMFISDTGVPTGNGADWTQYQFTAPNFPDYPKISVWNDSYFIGANEVDTPVYALPRDAMLAGAGGDITAQVQRFSTVDVPNWPRNHIMPADIEGHRLAPTGTPGIFVRQVDDEFTNPATADPGNDFLELWEFDPDFVTPANSTYTLTQTIPIEDFDYRIGRVGRDDIPQPGTANRLDALPHYLGWRLSYRNVGEYEALVGNFTVDANEDDTPDFDGGTAEEIAGIRWFELRRHGGGAWEVHQEQTYSPDTEQRWMGAAAMNLDGDIALGFSVASATTFPSIAYAGRRADDPLDTLPNGDYLIVAGGGVETGTQRWGDYSSMNVDPVDDGTFWYTQQYLTTDTNFAWSSFVGELAFDDLDVTVFGTVGDDQLTLRRSGDFAEVLLAGTLIKSVYLPDTNSLTIIGLAGDDNLTVDYSGGDPIPSGGLHYEGGPHASPLPGDQITITGTGSQHGIYTPSSITPGAGMFEIDERVITFTGLEPATVSGMAEFLFVSPNSNDALTIDSPLAGRNRISGTSGGVAFEALTFFNIAHFKVDTAVNDGPLGNPNDTVTFTADLVATNLLSFTIETGAGDDTVNASTVTTAIPLTILGGDGDDTLTGGAGADRLEGGVGNDTLTGSGGNDNLFGGADSDLIIWNPGDGSDSVEGGTGDNDRLQFTGSAAADTIQLRADATNPTRLDLIMGGVDMDIAGFETVSIPDHNDSDITEIFDLTTTDVLEVNVNTFFGGDTVIVHGRNLDDNIFISRAGPLVNDTAQVRGLRYDVNLIQPGGLDRLEVRGDDGDDVIKAAPGVEFAFNITLTGGQGDDFLSADAILNGGDGNDTLIGGVGDDTINGGAGDDLIDARGGAGNAIDGGTGTDTILVSGTAAGDTITTTHTGGTFAVTGGQSAGTSTITGMEQVRIEAGDGSDTINIITNAAGGLNYNALGGSPLGALGDTLNLTSASNLTFTAGPENDRGAFVEAATTNIISFAEIESIGVTLVAPADTVTIVGTGDDDHITVTGTAANTVEVQLNDGPIVTYAGVTNVVLQGNNGDDDIVIDPGVAALGVNFMVDGGSATDGTDTLTVDGLVNVVDAITYTPTNSDSGSVAIAAVSTVTFTDIEQLQIDGQNDDLVAADTLDISSFNIDATQVLTPGSQFDSGDVEFRDGGFTASLATPIAFRRLGVGGSLMFSDIARFDNLIYRGTDLNDTFSVDAAGQVLLNSQIVVNTPSIVTLTLAGLEGDDTFSIVGDHNLPDVAIQGGDPSSGSDVLNFTGAGAAVTVDLGLKTVAEAGFSTVAYSGIETIRADAGGVGLNVVATGEDDDLTVTVLDANSGSVEHGYTMNRLGQPISAAAAPLVHYTNTGGNPVNVDLAAGEDTLNVVGNALAQSIDINVTTRTVAIDDDPNGIGNDGTVTYVNNESLGVFGLEGGDTFDVTPGMIPVFIDGGDPIGNSAGDTINTNAGGAAVTFEAGPENDEGGILVAGSQRISYDHIEALGVTAAMKALFIGTNGDDDITVIARDASTHALADGVQDFTISLNGGPAILFVDTPELYIDAISGDDDIVLRTPAPNDASWDVDVYVSGGAPSDGAPTEGDRLVLETPDLDSIIYTPTGSDSGTILIDDDNDGVAGGVDSLITLGQFTVICPGLNYTSDAGGIELLEYDGEGAGDRLTIVAPVGDDTIVHTPGAGRDEGSLRVNTHLAIHYQNLGAAARLTVADTGGDDTLVVNGTGSDDAFDVAATSGAVALVTPSTRYLALNQTQVENLSLDGLDGNDDFAINGPQPYANINIFGGGPGGSDVLTVNGAAATDETFTVNPAFDRGDGTVSVNALLVPYIGIEHVLLDANPGDNDDLVINDDDADNAWVVDAGPIFGDRVQIDDRESIDFINFNDITLNNAFGTDRFEILPTNLIGFDGDFTVNGDGAIAPEPIDDVIELVGTEGADVVTSTASAVTVNGITITVGNTNFAELRVITLGGADVIGHDGLGGNPAPMALALPGVRKVVDAGNEDDIVNLSAMMDAIIFGGLGNDLLIGSPLADTIFGGPGNDILIGGGGSDFQFGEEGNDIFGNPSLAADGVADDPGQDFNFGGSGFDNFIWEPGDGPDINNGGDDGGDIFRFFGDAAANAFALRAGGTPTHFNALIGALVIDNHGIEDVRVDGMGGADTFLVNDLFETEVVSINLLLGAADGAIDAVTVNGRTTEDNLQITTGGAGNVSIEGLTYDINLNQAELANDTLTVNGNEGNDSIQVETGVETVLTSTLNGNLGDDLLSGWFNTANGNEGDDFIRGAGNAQAINGGAGEDTMVGGAGLDSFDGGSGFDTILVEGFASDDRIDLRQDNPTTLRHEVGNASNGFDGVLGGAGTETDTLAIATVEQVRIAAGAGDDTIRVAHDDSLVAAGVAVNMLRIDVDGGVPGASDRLTVIDDGAGDTNVQRLGQTDGDGSFTTYAFSGGNPANPIIALPPVIYTDVEYASLNPIGPVTGGTGGDGNGRLFVFKYDPYEQNQSLPTATFLGADSAINLDPNIDPGVDADFGTPGDEDWYRVVAEKTGTLDFQVYFRQQNTLANGRAGLPNAGNLDIAVFDADGLVNGAPLAIAGNGDFGNNDADDDERVRIPAVAGQTYYLRVVGAGLPAGNDVNASPSINAYNVSVVNEAPATPFDLELADNLTILTGAQEVPAVATRSNGTANFQYNSVTNTFNLDLFVAGLELTNTTSQPELLFAHIHRGAVGVNGPVIVTLSGGIGGWVQEPSGIRLKLTNAPFSPAAADITALLAGDTYINVHSTANPTGEVRGQIGIQNVLGVTDSGRSQFDNVTQDTTPTILLRLDDALLLNDLPGNPAGAIGATPPDQTITIPHILSTAASPLGLPAGYRVAIYDETDTHNPVLLGFAQPVPNLNGVYSFTFTTPLAEGSHFISSRVQMIDPADNDANVATLTPATGFGPRSTSLEIVVDTPPPPVSFGDAAVLGDGLHPDSDSGDPAVPGTLVDRITNDTTPTFFGRAEANAVVRLYVDIDGNSIISPPDVLIGQTVAVPTDGTNQSPNGEWEITSTVNMNDPNRLGALGVDGARKILVQAEDLAGNLSGNGLAFELDIFIDTRGPQVTDVFISNRPDFDLFTLKPDTPEPTPRVDSLTINVQDLPNRVAAFLYPAISNLAVIPNVLPLGLISLVGDHSGIIPMTSVTFTSDGNLNLPGVQPLAPGNPATGFITLQFASPLPDDRFTLTLSDSIIDPAGNALDGESNASEPVGTPLFPSGDGIPGGDFVARFTVDSRPEIGTWSQELVYVDINGNFVWDPEGQDNDATNRDFIYHFGTTTDAYFSGNFASNFLPGADGILGTGDDVAVNPNAVTSSGFDKMGTFGRFNGQYEFFLDTNDDGIGDTVGPMFFQVNVIPVAGNFFNSAADMAAVAAGQRPRDEIGGFDGQNWYLDTNGNNQIDANERFATALRGIPVVGDFNGDGFDDLATFNNDTGVFQFDLDRNGTVDDTLTFFFSGFGEKPVAGDVNLDGIDDLVLWLPNRDGQLPKESGEFHFLVSDNPAENLPSNVFDGYSPAPLGNDLIAQFGDEFALPVLGNFDPPIGDTEPLDTTGWFTNLNNPLDVDNDGDITPYDALLVVNALNRGITSAQPSQALRVQDSFDGHFLDVDGNAAIDPFDVLQIINELNRQRRTGGAQSEAAPATVASYAAAVDTLFSSEEDDDDRLLDWAENDAQRNTL